MDAITGRVVAARAVPATLRDFRYRRWKDQRIYQFDTARSVRGFPARRGDALKDW